jgi:hypothetical protein
MLMRWRRAMLAAAEPALPRRRWPLSVAWTASALVLAALAGLAVLRVARQESKVDDRAYAAHAPVRLELRATNGTRIYWVVRPAQPPASDPGGSDDGT